MGLLGPNGEEEGQPKGSCWRPPTQSELDKEGAAPPFLPLSLLLPLILLLLGKEGVLLPVGVGLLPGAPPPGRPPLPLDPLYTGAGGTSRHNN